MFGIVSRGPALGEVRAVIVGQDFQGFFPTSNLRMRLILQRISSRMPRRRFGLSGHSTTTHVVLDTFLTNPSFFSCLRRGLSSVVLIPLLRAILRGLNHGMFRPLIIFTSSSFFMLIENPHRPQLAEVVLWVSSLGLSFSYLLSQYLGDLVGV